MELTVVIAVVGVLVILAMPRFKTTILERAQTAKSRTNVFAVDLTAALPITHSLSSSARHNRLQSKAPMWFAITNRIELGSAFKAFAAPLRLIILMPPTLAQHQP